MSDQPSRDILLPPEMREKAIQSGVAKSKISIVNLLILSVLAGAYIAFGAVFSSIIALGMPGVWPYGFMKVAQGLAFSMGLILVIIGGAELFTGNNLMVMAWLDRKIRGTAILKNWAIVFVGNFVGSVLVALLIILSKEYLVSEGSLGKSIVSLAVLKVGYPFVKAMVLGILCNILVCLAVWLTYSGRSTIDKILAIIFPITAFIAAGFEHSVANMYIIPVALLLNKFNPAFVVQTGINTSTLTWTSFFVNNLVPVTIGNILGGAFFVGFLYFLAYKKPNP
jgi:formate/nitrite transporter